MTIERRYNTALQDLRDHGKPELAEFGRTCLPCYKRFAQLWNDHPEYHNGHDDTWTVNAQYLISQYAKGWVRLCRG